MSASASRIGKPHEASFCPRAFVREVLIRRHWDATQAVIIEEQAQPQLVSARMADFRTIFLTVHPQLLAVLATRFKSATTNIARALVYYQLAHTLSAWEICPLDAVGHGAIYAGVARAIRGGVKVVTPLERRVTHLVAGLYIDTVLHAVLALRDRWRPLYQAGADVHLRTLAREGCAPAVLYFQLRVLGELVPSFQWAAADAREFAS